VTRGRIAIATAGTAAGFLVERLFYDRAAGPALAAADLTVGCVLFWCGAITWDRRPQSRVGALMTLGGATWFAGNVATALVYLHRAPLIHLHLSYPDGRVRSRLVLLVIVAAYVTSAIVPLARNDVLTVALAFAGVLAPPYRLYPGNLNQIGAGGNPLVSGR
jgi:hypothetical protein